jgi:hypothetical protein
MSAVLLLLQQPSICRTFGTRLGCWLVFLLDRSQPVQRNSTEALTVPDISVPPSSEVISTKQLVKKTLACIHTLSREAAHVLASQECLSWLNNNPEGRNLVMLVSADRLPAYKTQEVLEESIFGG